MTHSKGNLYLIPTPLGELDHHYTLPSYNNQIISTLDCFIVEELRTARRFLRKAGYNRNFETVVFHVLNEHTRPEETSGFLLIADQGQNIGLLSEAGCPAVADPGSVVVKIAHEKGIRVVPLTGPSSIILSLMASGLNGQSFTFHGYLPVKPPERKIKLKELDRFASRHLNTQIFIEAPYRNRQMIDAILENCSDQTLLCIASNVTMFDEFIVTKTISEWRKIKPDPGKRPTVFLLG
jgi:16S rRNA (cytidine1402-2'-O)-methyltransferase